MLRASRLGRSAYGKGPGTSSCCFVQAWGFQSGWLHSAAFDKGPSNDIHVHVKNGINSPIGVRLIHPPVPEPNGPIILDLGSGRPLNADRDEAHDLSSLTNAIIVRPTIHPSRSSPYPAPIHQTLAVFDWIGQELGRTTKARDDPGRSKIGVLGELEAGGLATMLALTECSPTRPHISAASIFNPVLDWTDVIPEDRDMVPEDLTADSITNPQDAEAVSGMSTPSTSALVARRKEIFLKPDHFFDPFASPLLFFRTPCFDLPYKFAHPAQSGLSEGSEGDAASTDGSTMPLRRKRTYDRRFPSSKSESVFPPMRLAVSEDWMLKRQSLELQHLVDKSLRRQERRHGEGEMPEQTSHVLVEEVNLSKSKSTSDVLLAARWLGEVLRRS